MGSRGRRERERETGFIEIHVFMCVGQIAFTIHIHNVQTIV